MTPKYDAILVFPNTVQKIKFSIDDSSSKCDQIRSFLWIWSHLLKKSFMENFDFCAAKFGQVFNPLNFELMLIIIHP